ncbi:pyridoxamine 5'-phosphate oxidase family protein [Luminiphilus sp.]|nr:pyridoxamine 5'-phosphate oxidase family protein [Luminiphilus sp.]
MTETAPSAPPCEALAHLKTALRKNRRHAHHRYFQLASVTAEGYPRNRTVVFRGFATDDQTLLVITDSRSDKVAEFAQNGAAEIAWYFTETREQFRIRAVTSCISDSTGSTEDAALREQVWRQLSDAARAQFFWRSPGLALGAGTTLVTTEAVPETFALLKLSPVAIDHLVLSKVQTRRHSQLIDNHWHEQWINP